MGTITYQEDGMKEYRHLNLKSWNRYAFNPANRSVDKIKKLDRSGVRA